MEGWRETTLGKEIDIIVGGTPKTSCAEYWGGQIPWISVADFNTGRKFVFCSEKSITSAGLNNSATKLLAPGDIIISARGTVGAMAVLAREMAFNQSCYGIRARNGIMDQNYTYYVLKKSIAELLQFAHGGVFDTITKATFDELEILLPPLPEQQAIAAVLSSFDDKIDLLHRQNETLESLAQTLFRQWFVEEADKGKERNIADFIDFNPKRQLGKGTTAPYIEMSALSSTSFSPSTWYKRDFSSGTKFTNGDTLLARITPCLENGKAAFIQCLQDGEIAWGSTEYIVLRPKKFLHPLFAYALAKTADFREYAESCLAGSSGRQRVELQHLMQYSLRMPTPVRIQQFNECMESLQPRLTKNANQIRILTKLRDTLLPKLMSGEIRVLTGGQ